MCLARLAPFPMMGVLMFCWGPEFPELKILVVYYLDGKWYGEEASYKALGKRLLQGVLSCALKFPNQSGDRAVRRREPLQD